MRRDYFVKIAATTLREGGIPNADAFAEAIAARMEEGERLLAILGDSPSAAPAPPPLRAPAFPAANPAAVAPAPEEGIPSPSQTWPAASPDPQPSLIVPSTTMPDASERVDPQALCRASAPPPIRSLRPAQKMTVQDLNLLIQERTPNKITFDVPMEDGPPQRVTFQRNVVSMNNFDSVKLIYFPPNASKSIQEFSAVSEDLHIDDVPHDLPAIIKRLTEKAVTSLKPRGPVVAAEPKRAAGAVQSNSTYDDGASPKLDDATTAGQVQAVFTGIG
jgi:hypothetical protein